jgi:plasmid stabilization system protein ParE
LARIQFSERIDTDLRRIVEHMREHASTDRDERLSGVIAAIDVLMASPLIGRPCDDGLRELVIGRGMRGCLALYHYDERMDLVRILAIRSQKESGYHHP